MLHRAKTAITRNKIAYAFLLSLSVAGGLFYISGCLLLKTINTHRSLTASVPTQPQEVLSLKLLTQGTSQIPPASATPPANLPDVKIHGIVFSSHPGRSQVIISTPAGQKVYRVNDPLPEHPPLKVADISTDSITVEFAGQHHRIPLIKDPGKRQGNGAPVATSRKTLAAYIAMDPVYGARTQVKGLRLNSRVGPGPFKGVGLIPGDIAVRINNIDLNTQQHIALATDEIGRLTKAQLTLLRNEGMKLVTVSVSDFKE